MGGGVDPAQDLSGAPFHPQEVADWSWSQTGHTLLPSHPLTVPAPSKASSPFSCFPGLHSWLGLTHPPLLLWISRCMTV